MNTVLAIIVAILMCAFFLVFAVIAQYLISFYDRKCKYCKHNMIYRGEKNTKEGSVLLFECTNCGHKEEIPTSEFENHLNYIHYEQ